MKNLNLTVATIAALTLIGCGGGSTSNSNTSQPEDAFKIQKAEYTLNGEIQPTCHNAYSRSGIESNSERLTCTWICAEYEGASPVSVVLSFDKVGGNWEFNDDTVLTGPSQCHN